LRGEIERIGHRDQFIPAQNRGVDSTTAGGGIPQLRP
jgi:hypothetical protein